MTKIVSAICFILSFLLLFVADQVFEYVIMIVAFLFGVITLICDKKLKFTVSSPEFPMIAIGVDSTQFGIALIWVSFIISWK